eukprot:GHRR01026956.1.p1 GENE.GHRR01026956.1~~GHRR01026956.1.p1  ORF type:complete len:406 (+),score=133.15 GHRR01026956.1:152-1369(+)
MSSTNIHLNLYVSFGLCHPLPRITASRLKCVHKHRLFTPGKMETEVVRPGWEERMLIKPTSRRSPAEHAKEQHALLVQCLLRAVFQRNCCKAERLLLKYPYLIKARDAVMCQLLLEFGADLGQRDTVGATPLIHAAAHGATAVVQLLINSKQGANTGRQWLLQQTTTGGETAVMAAAKGGHLDTLQQLCAVGAETAAVNKHGQSALWLACKHNKPTVVQHLIQQCNCDCNQADSTGTTPLMRAAAAAAKDVVILLLQNSKAWGLQLGAVDQQGQTAIAYAARGDDPKLLSTLNAAGLPLTAHWPVEVEGEQQARKVRAQQQAVPAAAAAAAMAAAVSKQESTSIDSLCLDGGDALMYTAAGAGSIGVVQWLLQHGIGEISRLQSSSRNPFPPLLAVNWFACPQSD